MESPSQEVNRLGNYYMEVKSLRRKLERDDLPEEKKRNAQARLLQVTNELIPPLVLRVS